MNSVHSRITFRAADHSYEYEGRRLLGVTEAVGLLVPKFDRNGNADRIAKRDCRSVAAVLAEWDAKSQAALVKGNTVHGVAQRVLMGGEGLDEECLEARIWVEWWGEVKTCLVPLAVEKVVGDLGLGVAGTLDAVMYSGKTDKTHVFDWKTGGKFETENRWGRYLLPPFSDLPDNELHRYSLQVSLYRLILERNMVAGWPGSGMGSGWILHLKDKATLHKAIDYRERLRRWLEGRKITC